MKRQTFSILFFIKKGKPNKKNEVPIFCRLTILNEKIELFTQRSVLVENWNADKGATIGKSKELIEINERLELMRFQIYQAQESLINNNEAVTPINIKKKVLGIEEKEDEITLIDYYQQHNDNLKKQVGKGFAIATWERHETNLRILKCFFKTKYNKDIKISDLTVQFVKDFNYYLRVNRNNSQNTATKYTRNLGKIINEAYQANLIKLDIMSKCKFTTEEIEKPYLTKTELQSIINKQFSIKRIENVKDIFLFCCFTGLSYTDCKSLNKNEIIIENGNYIIKKKRQKTGVYFQVILLPVAVEILKKHNYKLPIPSNQKMNAYLKEIADLCSINKVLTCHVARHTFATTVTLANGISIASVSSLLGHSSIRQTQHYAKIMNEVVNNEMIELSKKLTF